MLGRRPKPLTPKEARHLESFGYCNQIFGKLQAWISLEETTARSVFEKIDKDGNGIDVDELCEALLALGLEVPMQAWEMVFKLLDPDMTGRVSYADFCGVVRAYEPPVTQVHISKKSSLKTRRHPLFVRTPSVAAPSDAEVTGIAGYRCPVRQGKPASESLAMKLENPPKGADPRRQYWARQSAYINIAPNLVFDPLGEELAQLALEHRYGTSKDLNELLKLYEQKCGQKGVLSEAGFGSILKRHGIKSEYLVSKLYWMYAKNKVVSFQGLLASLGLFTANDRRKEVTALYHMCSTSAKGKEITKAALLRFLVAANADDSQRGKRPQVGV